MIIDNRNSNEVFRLQPFINVVVIIFATFVLHVLTNTNELPILSPTQRISLQFDLLNHVSKVLLLLGD